MIKIGLTHYLSYNQRTLTPMNGYARTITIASLLFIGLTAALFFLKPIEDNDFWWHLRTGQYIVETGGLPDRDPFLFTAGEPTPSGEFRLKSCWLSQVLLYLSYVAGGFGGVIILRVFILTLMFAVLYLRLKEECSDPPITGFVMLLSIIVFGTLFHSDRPFILSFLCSSLLLWLLDGIKKGKRRGFLIPPLMLLWSNSHGGFVVGIGIIVVYAASEGIKFLSPSLRPVEKARFLHLCIWGAVGAAFSFVNPATYKVVSAVTELYEAGFSAYNLERQSSVYFFTHLGDGYTILFYWAMLLMGLFALVSRFRNVDITDAVIFLSFGAVSFLEIRHIGFFVFASGPIAVRYLGAHMRERGDRAKSFCRYAASVLLVCSLAAVAIPLNIIGLPKFGQWVNTSVFPFKAADFIERVGLRGNIYNERDWGGFLIWRFYPRRKLFVDSRDLTADMYFTSLSIERGDADMLLGLPRWKALLNGYDVEIILVPLLERSGNIFPLVRKLFSDDEWHVVYYYQNSLVFVRDAALNRGIIDIYSIPKRQVLSEKLLRAGIY